jgi:hypothetical protein
MPCREGDESGQKGLDAVRILDIAAHGRIKRAMKCKHVILARGKVLANHMDDEMRRNPLPEKQ